MRYRQDLQVGLRERLRKLLVSDHAEAGHEVRLIVDWINRQPPLRTILTEAAEAEPDLDFDEFNEHLPKARRGISWPSRTEEGRASLIWRLMQHIAAVEAQTGRGNKLIMQYSFGVSAGSTKINDGWRASLSESWSRSLDT